MSKKGEISSAQKRRREGESEGKRARARTGAVVSRNRRVRKVLSEKLAKKLAERRVTQRELEQERREKPREQRVEIENVILWIPIYRTTNEEKLIEKIQGERDGEVFVGSTLRGIGLKRCRVLPRDIEERIPGVFWYVKLSCSKRRKRTAYLVTRAGRP